MMRNVLMGLLIAAAIGLLAGVLVPVGGPEAGVALAQPRQQFYTVTTRELPIPSLGDATGNLQEDVLCRPGDVAVGGGHIVHPSSTTGVFVTKSYATNAAGDFAPSNADRWRVKVLNPNAFPEKKLTVHVVCSRAAP